MAIEELTLKANGLTFHLLADGPPDGPLVLFLHGFPELARSWRSQLPAFAAAGYRAVAPDLRGYGGSDKTGPFDLHTLSKDVAGLVRALGREKATLVGHDWGGGVAWATAHLEPQVVEKLVVLNCTHPAVLAGEILSNFRQFRRCWYIFLFQVPLLPELVLTRDRGAAVARALRGGSTNRSVWPREETEHYRQSIVQPGAAKAAVGYYRSALRHALGNRSAMRARPITAPTLIVWGLEDQFLGRETIAPEKMRAYFAEGNMAEIRPISGAGHFVQNEAAHEVNAAILGWLKA